MDSREKVENRAIIQDILTQHKVPFHVPEGGLKCGDFFITNMDMGIERKTVADLCSQFDHVRDQLRRCREAYRRTALLIEGKWNVDRQSGFLMRWEGQQKVISRLKARDLRRSLASWTLYHGIDILWSSNIWETGDYLADLAMLGEKPIRKVLGYDSQRHELRLLNMYASMPGIGEELAPRVMQKFPIPPIPSDWADKLIEVDGIGEKGVEKVRAWLRGDWRAKPTTLDEHMLIKVGDKVLKVADNGSRK